MNNKRVLIWIVVAIVLFLVGLFVFNKNADAGFGGTHWSDWKYKYTVSECKPVAKCGTDEGTKVIKEERECYWTFNSGYFCNIGDKQYREREVGCEVETPKCELPTPTPTEIPEPTPTEKPTPTEQPKAPENPVNTEVGAPEAPHCDAPDWAPELTFNGSEFEWSDVGTDQYWLDYGPTADNLPHSVVVNGNSFMPQVEWTGHIWAQVRGDDQGCLGPASQVVDP